MRADLVLVGFGNVARRFVRLLDERRAWLRDEFDLETRIVGIATKRHGSALAPDGMDALWAADVVEDGESLASMHEDASGPPPLDALDLIARADASGVLPAVIETTTLEIVDGQPAIDHVRAALRAGFHVVTANKGPVAFAYDELRDAAVDAGRSFLFEGTVMDGVPVFNLVRETLPAVTVLGFRGVVNSTTNHILTALEDGEDFGPALERMQKAGIAEADPSLDVDGWDAAAKAAALANVLMDAHTTPHEVRRTGLDADSAPAVRRALARGNRMRLVASAHRGEAPKVALVELPEADLLAGLRGMANAIVLRTDLLGEIAIHQLDGSLTQTAYALLSDLVTIRRGLPPAPPGARARHIP